MGCGPSTSDGKPVVVPAHAPPGTDVRRHAANGRPNGSVTSATNLCTANQNGRGDINGVWEEISVSTPKLASAMNGHKPHSTSKKKVSKSVAFEINLDTNCNDVIVDSKKMPTHLKSKLAPIVNAPRMTADMLVERQRIVEQNRLQELDKKKQASRQSSRLRKSILDARLFEEEQTTVNEVVKLQDKQCSAGRNRENRLASQAEKKRLREERAERVRLRAQQKRQEEEAGYMGIELEKDTKFNDDADSWLSDDDETTQFHSDLGERLLSAAAAGDTAGGTERVTAGTERVTSGTERVYSGRESPAKRFNPRRARLSASTVGSFDDGLPGSPPGRNYSNRRHLPAEDDDFFDT